MVSSLRSKSDSEPLSLQHRLAALCDHYVAEKQMRCHGSLGASVICVQNGRVVLEKHYGDKGVDTLFSLMSSTKLLVSLLTLRLQDRGLLSVDDAVEKYIPEYAHIKVLCPDARTLRTPLAKPTVKQLMDHTGAPPLWSPYMPVFALPHYRKFMQRNWNKGRHLRRISEAVGSSASSRGLFSIAEVTNVTLAEMVGHWLRRPLEAEPGTVFSYGYGSGILGRVCEVAAGDGRRLSELLQEFVAAPLGISKSDLMIAHVPEQLFETRLSQMRMQGTIVRGLTRKEEEKLGLEEETAYKWPRWKEKGQTEDATGEGVATARAFVKVLTCLANGGFPAVDLFGGCPNSNRASPIPERFLSVHAMQLLLEDSWQPALEKLRARLFAGKKNNSREIGVTSGSSAVDPAPNSKLLIPKRVVSWSAADRRPLLSMPEKIGGSVLDNTIKLVGSGILYKFIPSYRHILVSYPMIFDHDLAISAEPKAAGGSQARHSAGGMLDRAGNLFWCGVSDTWWFVNPREKVAILVFEQNFICSGYLRAVLIPKLEQEMRRSGESARSTTAFNPNSAAFASKNFFRSKL